MTYWPEESKPRCEWLFCIAGMGLAGRGSCDNHGAWWMQCCPEYENEDDAIERWQAKEV